MSGKMQKRSIGLDHGQIKPLVESPLQHNQKVIRPKAVMLAVAVAMSSPVWAGNCWNGGVWTSGTTNCSGVNPYEVVSGETVGGNVTAIAGNTGGTARVDVTNSTVNLNAMTHGVYAYAAGTGSNALINLSGNNTINLGAADTAVLAMADIGTITVNAGGVLNITNAATGGERDGLEITGTSGGTIEHHGSGTITTNGGNAIFSRVSNGSSTVIVDGGATLNTSGAGSNGIRATAGGAGNASVTTGGSNRTTILTNGNDANGVYASASGTGNATVQSTNDSITTQGDRASGLKVDVVTGTARIISNGSNISVTGTDAHALEDHATGAGGNAVVDSTGGFIETEGDNSHGIFAVTDAGTAKVDSHTKITTDGINSSGIRAESDTGDVIITASKDISTQGTGASTGSSGGIVGISKNGTQNVNQVYIDYNDTAGIINIKGSASSGTIAGISGETLGTSDADIVIKANASLITTSTTSSNSAGINAIARGEGNIDVTFSGSIHAAAGNTAAGTTTNADGMQINANGGNVSVKASGRIETNGNGNSEGIWASSSGGTGNVIVTSSADIKTTGSGAGGARGIVASSVGGNAEIEASGNIETTGGDDDSANTSLLGGNNGGILAIADAAGKRAYVKYDDVNGHVSTHAFSSHAILADGKTDANAEIKIGNAIFIRTEGDNSYGLLARAGTGAARIEADADQITTVGKKGAVAVGAQSTGNDASVLLTGKIETLGRNTADITAGNHAVLAKADAVGKTAFIQFNDANGYVNTQAGGSHGLYADGGTDANATVKLVDAAFNSTIHHISTKGDQSYGALAKTGDGDALLLSATNVVTEGIGAVGLASDSAGGNAYLGATGNITTLNTGTAAAGTENAHGLFVRSGGDSTHSAKVIYDDRYGQIQIKGSGANNRTDLIAGVMARSDNQAAAIISMANVDKILMSDASYSAGLAATGSGDGNLTIDFLNGEIQSSNLSGTVSHANGVFARSFGAGDINILSKGKISLYGAHDSIGITGWSAGGNTTVTALGQIETFNGDRKNTSIGNHGVHAGVDALGTTAAILFDDAAGYVRTDAGGSHVMFADGGQSGDAVIASLAAAELKTMGDESHVLAAQTQTGNIAVRNLVDLQTFGDRANGINARTTSGFINIDNIGAINTSGDVATGISATTSGPSNTGDAIYVVNTAPVSTVDGAAIVAQAKEGDVTVWHDGGEIWAGRRLVTTQNHGVVATSESAGKTSAYISNALIRAHDTMPGHSVGIIVGDNGSRAQDVNAFVNLGSGSAVYANGGIQMSTSGNGIIQIEQGARVHGGNAWGIDLQSSGSPDSGHLISTLGFIEAMNDRAIQGDLDSGHAVINNHGTIAGYVDFNTANTVEFNNWTPYSWDVRHYQDSNGDGIRDTKYVAVSRFGGNGVINNERSGVIRLLPVLDNINTVTTNEYLPNNSFWYSTIQPGVTQAQFLGVERFENRGLVDMSLNGQPGDVIVISKGFTPGVNGGGVYVSDGGTIKMDTVLNTGGLMTKSDLLSVDNVYTGFWGPTTLDLNVTKEQIALTEGDGIQLVQVLGLSTPDAFRLARPVYAGPFDYQLFQGARSNPFDGSWYLRNVDNSGRPIYRGIVGGYLANQVEATSLFMHSLHDRLGEPQYLDPYGIDAGSNNIKSVWARIKYRHTDSKAGLKNAIDMDRESYLVQFGGDLAQWYDGNSRVQFGLMGGYGESKSDTSTAQNAQGKGKLDGYSVGAYATWFRNTDKPKGLYVDGWAQYSWFKNKVDAPGHSSEKYNSSVWTVSAEAGYAFIAHEGEKRQWMIEPQFQVSYNWYNADNHKSSDGLEVSGYDADGVVTRLGARVYSRSRLNGNGIQPFVEANWLYSSAKNGVKFDGYEVRNNQPDNRFEVKAGIQGEVSKGWQLWGHIGGQWGDNSYQSYEGMVGVKHLW